MIPPPGHLGSWKKHMFFHCDFEVKISSGEGSLVTLAAWHLYIRLAETDVAPPGHSLFCAEAHNRRKCAERRRDSRSPAQFFSSWRGTRMQHKSFSSIPCCVITTQRLNEIPPESFPLQLRAVSWHRWPVLAGEINEATKGRTNIASAIWWATALLT